MLDRRLCAALLLVLLLTPALAGAQQDLGEEDVTVELDPGQGDEVTVYLPREETDQPERTLRERADEAGVPVRDVRVTTERERRHVVVDGRVVDERETYWKATIVTTLGERRGLLAREIPAEELQRLSGTGSPELTVHTYRGTTLRGSEVSHDGGLLVQRHRVDGTSDLAHGLPLRQVAVLLGWLVVSIAAPALGYRKYANRIARSDEPAPTRLHRLQTAQGNYAVFWTVGCAAVGVALGSRALSSQLVAALGPAVTVASWVDGTLWLLAVAPFTAALLASEVALLPLRSALRGVERSAWSTLRGGCRELLEYGLLLWLLLALVAVLPAWTTANPITGALLLGAVVLARVALSPYLLRLSGNVRPADDRLRAEVERLWSDAGHDPPRVYLRDAGDAAGPDARLAGIHPCQHVFVSEQFVDALDQSDRAALLTHHVGRAQHRHVERYPLIAAGCGLLGLGVLWLFGSLWIFGSLGWADYLAVFLLYGVLKQTYARRHGREADDYVASRGDVDAFAAALDRVAAVNLTPDDPDEVEGVLDQYPPLVERVERLRDEAAEGADAGAGADAGHVDAAEPPDEGDAGANVDDDSAVPDRDGGQPTD